MNDEYEWIKTIHVIVNTRIQFIHSITSGDLLRFEHLNNFSAFVYIENAIKFGDFVSEG